MMSPSPALGQHALLELHGCDVAILRDVAALEQALLAVATDLQATVLFRHFHHFGGDFGVTGVLLLAESHISIHTWTEHAFAAADIFVCGQTGDLQAACTQLAAHLKAKHCDCQIQARGMRFDDCKNAQ